jgi:hypothetical protein
LGQVAIYCRVSTEDQSCQRQERDLRAFAKRAGHEIVAVFKETASGQQPSRQHEILAVGACHFFVRLCRASRNMAAHARRSALASFV